MEGFLSLIWFLGGPALGFYFAKKRGVSIYLGMFLGLLTGPCLGALLVPLIMGMIDGGASVEKLPQRGAGRSFSVDENPDMKK